MRVGYVKARHVNAGHLRKRRFSIGARAEAQAAWLNVQVVAQHLPEEAAPDDKILLIMSEAIALRPRAFVE